MKSEKILLQDAWTEGGFGWFLNAATGLIAPLEEHHALHSKDNSTNSQPLLFQCCKSTCFDKDGTSMGEFLLVNPQRGEVLDISKEQCLQLLSKIDMPPSNICFVQSIERKASKEEPLPSGKVWIYAPNPNGMKLPLLAVTGYYFRSYGWWQEIEVAFSDAPEAFTTVESNRQEHQTEVCLIPSERI